MMDLQQFDRLSEENRRSVLAVVTDRNRLRDLIKKAEWSDHTQGEWLCPWCEAPRQLGRHHDTCEAFTGEGRVR